MLKLPRELENDPRHDAIAQVLAKDVAPLWTGGTATASYVPFTSALEQALVEALRARQLERGLETIDGVLDRERRGLEAAQQKGAAKANRISRVLVMADDGAERFYRQVEGTLKRNADRVQALRVSVGSERFSEKLFGADKLVKIVLVADRDAVVRVLASLAP